nr:hypothetical protein [uncultured Desulfobulbus sp.]
MRRSYQAIAIYHLAATLLLVLVSVFVCAAENPLETQLQRLKELKEADLITEEMYSSEVKRLLRQLDAPGNQPKPKLSPVELLIPKVEWGDLNDYFAGSNLRSGIYAPEGVPAGLVNISEESMATTSVALYFDVRCRHPFIDRYIFEAVFYTAENETALARVPVQLKRLKETEDIMTWHKDEQAIASIPIPINQKELELSAISRVVFEVSDPFTFPVPSVEWTVLPELFYVTNLRSGPFVLRDPYDYYKRLVPAVLFDVEAKFSFSMGTASFRAHLFDAKNACIGTVSQVHFTPAFISENQRDAFIDYPKNKTGFIQQKRWPKGGRASAAIPFVSKVEYMGEKLLVDVEPGRIAKIVLRQN